MPIENTPVESWTVIDRKKTNANHYLTVFRNSDIASEFARVEFEGPFTEEQESYVNLRIFCNESIPMGSRRVTLLAMAQAHNEGLPKTAPLTALGGVIINGNSGRVLVTDSIQFRRINIDFTDFRNICSLLRPSKKRADMSIIFFESRIFDTPFVLEQQQEEQTFFKQFERARQEGNGFTFLWNMAYAACSGQHESQDGIPDAFLANESNAINSGIVPIAAVATAIPVAVEHNPPAQEYVDGENVRAAIRHSYRKYLA